MRAFIIPMRTDLFGMNAQVLDLRPNTSLKNNNINGEGQSCYASPGIGVAGTTVFNGDAYVSGSKLTVPILDTSADDTTGGGNDVLATQAAALGLPAYLRERVQPGGVALATAGRMAVADSYTLAMAIIRRVGATSNIQLADINTVLSNPALGGTANTDLDGTAALSKSFGTVVEILRILSGEVYRSPRFVIICNVANQFRSLAERNVLVAAQDVASNGGITFVSQGGFLTATENGYQGIPTTAVTEELLGSLHSGDISVLEQNMTFTNPAHAYTAALTTATRPRAYYILDAALPAVVPTTGIAPGVSVYNELGVRL